MWNISSKFIFFTVCCVQIFGLNGLITQPNLSLATKPKTSDSRDFCLEKSDGSCNDIDRIPQDLTDPQSWRPNTDSRFNLLQNYMAKMMMDTECQNVIFMFEHANITAHKFVLAARNEVFKGMFKGSKLNEFPIKMGQEFVPEGIKGMLSWAYTGVIEDYEDYALDILKVANQYRIYPLILECEAILEKQINDGNAAEFLIVADAVGAEHLKKGVFKFIKGNRHIVDSQAFQDKLTSLGGRLLAELMKAM